MPNLPSEFRYSPNNHNSLFVSFLFVSGRTNGMLLSGLKFPSKLVSGYKLISKAYINLLLKKKSRLQ